MKSRQLRLSPELAFDSISCLKPNTGIAPIKHF